MRDFLNAAKLLLLDLASTIFFLGAYVLTHNTILAVSLGIALGLAQIVIEFAREKPIDAMQWLSLFLVVASGTATLLTSDPRFVLLKPSLLYAMVGVVMLKPGWLNRYLPDIARAVVPDVAEIVGFAWSGLTFVSAAVNAVVALTLSVETWALIMPIYSIVSKAIVFVAGFAALRIVARRRVRAMPTVQRDALLAATERH